MTNEGAAALRLRSVDAPHGRYRAETADLDAPVAPGGSTECALDVAVDPSGTEIENAFLILVAEAADRTWRILARLRVRTGEDGVPRPRTERIDAQEVGFGGPR